MIRVCIVGPNSYIGGSVFERLQKEPEKYNVDFVSVKDEKWRSIDLSQFDTVVYAAGIVHRREKDVGGDMYYKVNRDTTLAFARAAKQAGVGQFIFLSSMSVFGLNSGYITKNLEPKPKTFYGKSKLEAEKLLNQMNGDDFAVAIVRPPLVYGRNCKGNYLRLRGVAAKLPLFPKFHNKRSLVHIDNLCEAIKLIIDSRLNGTFHPQNEEYVDVCRMIQDIASAHGKKLLLVPGFSALLNIAAKHGGSWEKVFADLTYDMDMSVEPVGYRVVDYKKSIDMSEEGSRIEGR